MTMTYDIDWEHVADCDKPVAACLMCSAAYALEEEAAHRAGVDPSTIPDWEDL